jgi:hypothetical protein
MLYLADFAVAALAGFGADALFSERVTEWRRLHVALKWIAIGSTVVLVADGLFSRIDMSPFLTLSLVLLLASSGLIWRAVNGDRGRWIQCLFAGLILFDLYAFNWDAMNVMELQVKNQDQLDRLLSLRGAADFLKRQPGPFRVQLLADPISNIGDAFGIEATWGAAATVVQDYWHYRDLNVWNARYTIRPASAADAGAVYADRQWKVYRNDSDNPRAWIVHKVIAEGSEEKQEIAIRSPSMDLRSVGVVSKPLGVVVNSPADPGDHVDLKEYHASAPVVGVYSRNPALLVLSEVDTPGWRATVNSVPAEIVRVDGVLRGVAVPAGYSRVEMRYRPMPVYAGAVVTLATFIGLCCGWLLNRNRNRVRHDRVHPNS